MTTRGNNAPYKIIPQFSSNCGIFFFNINYNKLGGIEEPWYHRLRIGKARADNKASVMESLGISGPHALPRCEKTVVKKPHLSAVGMAGENKVNISVFQIWLIILGMVA